MAFSPGVELSVTSSANYSQLSSTDRSSKQTMEVFMDRARPVQLELLPLLASCRQKVPIDATTITTNIWGLGFKAQRQGSRRIDVNQLPCTSASEGEEEEEAEAEAEAEEDARPHHLSGLAHVGKRDLMIVPERGLDVANEHAEPVFPDVSSRASDEEEGGSVRKKLRLSKDQSALLEESFKGHSTLNPKQKSALAKQLNLRPRQVEVWFQNRRARTKMKQTEVDCELLKRCCESLTEENRRLQKEVAELRALKVGTPSCAISHEFNNMPLPMSATLAMCPSCERLAPHGMPSSPAPMAIVNSLSFSNKPRHFPLTLPSQSQPSAAY